MSVVVSQQLVMQRLIDTGLKIQGRNMPNVDGEPNRVDNDTYIEPKFVGGIIESADKVALDEYVFILQIDAYTKTNTGEGPQLSILDTLISYFGYGQELNNGNTKVIFNDIVPRVGFDDGDYYRQVYDINYRVITPKLGV